MKNLMLTAATLLVLAGSTYQIATVHSTDYTSKTTTTKMTGKFSVAAIPPPTCPTSDPNGCGILD